MLYFSLIMFLLAITTLVRGPVFNYSSIAWFFISWLPGELPWFFALIQIAGCVLFLLTSDSIGGTEIFSLVIGICTLAIFFHCFVKAWRSGPVLRRSLSASLGNDFESRLPSDIGVGSPSAIYYRNWLMPFRYGRPGIERLTDISYSDGERNKLDIYRLAETVGHTSYKPVLLHVHGGAWVIGSKYQQAQPLLKYLAQNGWICVDINYSLAPGNKFPACIVDVKKAIVWLKENISDYGGDPNFIAITGGSAGGHLSALAGLTGNFPQFQPGFEMADTQLQALIPVYGIYDVTLHDGDGPLMQQLLERYVMPTKFYEDQAGWKNVSPLYQISNIHLPTFVIHGDSDCVVPINQAQKFVHILKQKNTAPVLYAELPGAQHGFDIFHSVRTEFHIEAVGKFLHYCYAEYRGTLTR